MRQGVLEGHIELQEGDVRTTVPHGLVDRPVDLVGGGVKFSIRNKVA